LLTDHFIRRFANENQKEITEISREAQDLLVKYNFPGNVRELENIIERSLVLDNERITLDSLSAQVKGAIKRFDLCAAVDIPEDGIDLEPALENLEKQYLVKALEKSGGSKTKAAELLRMSFRSYRYKLSKFGLAAEGE
jgi:two-component system response regulator PilR (NtrC family)